MSGKIHAKSIALPIAMTGGIVLYKWMGYLTFLSPYLIFTMLFITYCKLDFRHIKPSGFEASLLGVQMLLSIFAYIILLPCDNILAQGIFICFFITTATAAPVVTAMLGGNISRVATYSLLGNCVMAVLGPLVLAYVGDDTEMTFLESFILIIRKVFPLLILPLVAASALRILFPKVHATVVKWQKLSFWLWAIALFIVVGSGMSFIILRWDINNAMRIIWLAILALPACVFQFWIGRKIGGKYGDAISGGQALGQKNTVLAVWLALAYLHPLSSVAPTAYIAWQNMINSWQMIKKDRKESQLIRDTLS